jgi:hypothetical protein
VGSMLEGTTRFGEEEGVEYQERCNEMTGRICVRNNGTSAARARLIIVYIYGVSTLPNFCTCTLVHLQYTLLKDLTLHSIIPQYSAVN